MTDPIGGGISSITSAGSGGDTAKQINEAAAPAQKQTGETLKASNNALNQQTQATAPTASAPPGTPPPSGSASNTVAGAVDPNNPGARPPTS